MIPRWQLIEKSLGCFDAGIFSLIPGLGVLFTPMAFGRFYRAVIETNDRWNPARMQLYLGLTLALLSLLAHAVVGTVLYVQFLRAVADG